MELISPQKAAAVARTGAAKLAALVGPDGRFLYRYLLSQPQAPDGVYSNARHIGALWAMLDWEGANIPVPGLTKAIDRAAGHMNKSLLTPYGGTGALCVIDEQVIKIGTVALGIAACVGLYRRGGDPANLERAIRLGRYVALQRRSDGDFDHIRIPGPVTSLHPMRADMFTGQAVYGLALLAETTGDEAWSEMALDSARKLAAISHGVAGHSHWMLYALGALYRAHLEGWLLDYASSIAESFMADTSYRAMTESTPVACRTEGLLVYAQMAGAAGKDRREALRHIRQGLRRQLDYYDPSGAFVRSHALPEVRIDYIFHNVIGFLGYSRLDPDAA